MWTPKVGDAVVVQANVTWYGAKPHDLSIDDTKTHTPLQDYPKGTTGWVHYMGKMDSHKNAMWVRFLNGELVPLGESVWQEFLKPLEPDHVQEG